MAKLCTPHRSVDTGIALLDALDRSFHLALIIFARSHYRPRPPQFPGPSHRVKSAGHLRLLLWGGLFVGIPVRRSRARSGSFFLAGFDRLSRYPFFRSPLSLQRDNEYAFRPGDGVL